MKKIAYRYMLLEVEFRNSNGSKDIDNFHNNY